MGVSRFSRSLNDGQFRWILAKLRNETFFSMGALNERIWELSPQPVQPGVIRRLQITYV
jgi:hypothetical protein